MIVISLVQEGNVGKKKKPKKISEKKITAPESPADEGKHERRKKRKRPSVPRMREHPNWPLTGLAVTGMVLTAYLTVTSWLGQSPLYCDQGSSCDVVQHSRWGTFFGIPTSLLGFLAYATLGHIGYRVRRVELHWKSAWTISLIGFGYSVYLNLVSLLVIEAACAYCLASLTIMTAIFGVVTFQRPEGLPDLNFKMIAAQAAIAAAVIIGGMHLHYSGVFDSSAGPEDPFLRGLAEHLSKEEAVMYGAYW